MSKQHRFSSYIASHRQLWIIGAVFALIYMGNGSFLPYVIQAVVLVGALNGFDVARAFHHADWRHHCHRSIRLAAAPNRVGTACRPHQPQIRTDAGSGYVRPIRATVSSWHILSLHIGCFDTVRAGQYVGTSDV